ncbi:immunoglobulin superfamily member 2-like [Anableps anableps]
MKFSMFFQWKPTLLILLGLFLRCEAKVNTEIQAGPLYRVVGSRLSISCSASGFSNPSLKKDFEIRMKDPARPSLEINVISTQDPGFSYNRFRARVQSKDVFITYVNPNSITFEIKNLRKEDEGEYECTVVNPVSTYDGSYTAMTDVKVIDNSLSVTSGESTTSLSYNEGEALTLTCQASTNTIQHVHLSFAWYLRKDGAQDAKPIISLDRDFTLAPGQGFEHRYSEEAISLDKLGETTYRLKMTELELSDQGQIYCQAQEWIQDPDRSWYMIAKKDAEEIPLVVKAKVVTDISAVEVSLSAQNTVQEGQELLLSCGINAHNLAKRFFSVAWLREGTELVRIGSTGILTVRQEYSDREKDGELKAKRTAYSNYQLRIKPVRTTDGGSYSCRAWPEERGEDGSFNEGAAQNSQPVEVKISTPESGLSVKLQNMKPALSPGEKLRLICEADGVKGQLSVAWQRKTIVSKSPLFTNVISLRQNGVTEKTEAFANREVRVMRPTTESFVFELDDVAESDSGIYACTVSEMQSNGKTQSQTQNANVTVKSIDSVVKVSLRNRDPSVIVGNDVHLMCKVSSLRIPTTVTWSQQTEDYNLNTILVLYSNGSISWSGDQHRYQVAVDNRGDTVMHYLKVLRASRREAGTYQCIVSVFMHNIHKRLAESYPVKVMVQNPESKLALSSSPTITQSINADIQIDCKVTSRTSEISLYAVTWELQQEHGNKIILTSDHNAIITSEPQIKPSHGQRISMKRTEGPTFELTIRQVKISDTGLYVCKVVEYLQDSRGEWYSLPQKNSTTELNVTEIETNLSIKNIEAGINVSNSKEFSIPCHITQQSSNESQFQVTWFWQKNTTAKPIFTAYRNSTLQAIDKNVAVTYDHPLPGQFDLTVNAENSGLYFCEVEEWLYSLANGWRKVAVEKSGNLNVTVDSEGQVKAMSGLACGAGTWIPIYAVSVFILICIILVLTWKMCRRKTSGGKNSAQTLWTEQQTLNPNTEL